MSTIDSLAAACPFCAAIPGQSCTTLSGRPCKPHKAREKEARDAWVLAAALDPALNEWFPLRNPCQFCTVLPQRHRVVEAIASALENGESTERVAAEQQVSPGSVGAVQAWMIKWPGAWR